VVDTNYISSIVKILENPIKIYSNESIYVTKFRVQLPEYRDKIIINVSCWGQLGENVFNYYKRNDYIIIEGYLSFRYTNEFYNLKKVEITVLKIYPFILESDFRSL
jgi:hypothetical protein